MATNWKYQSGGKILGPIDSEELKTLARNGGITPSSLIQKVGMDKWVAASAVKGLFDRAQAQPATDIQWHYSTGGKSYGPFDTEVIYRLIQEGQIGSEDHLWHKDLPGWEKISSFEQFSEMLPGDSEENQTVESASEENEQGLGISLIQMSAGLGLLVSGLVMIFGAGIFILSLFINGLRPTEIAFPISKFFPLMISAAILNFLCKSNLEDLGRSIPE